MHRILFQWSDTHDKVAENIKQAMDEYCLPPYKVSHVVKDSNSNFVKAFKQFSVNEKQFSLAWDIIYNEFEPCRQTWRNVSSSLLKLLGEQVANDDQQSDLIESEVA